MPYLADLQNTLNRYEASMGDYGRAEAPGDRCRYLTDALDEITSMARQAGVLSNVCFSVRNACGAASPDGVKRTCASVGNLMSLAQKQADVVRGARVKECF